ncbi:hypothetical protein ACUNFD_21070, partial [Serratia sp. IR-2025]
VIVTNIRSRSCAEQNEGLAYTTRVNCAETTITLCADNMGAHNVYYVKLHYWIRTAVSLAVLSHLTFKPYQAANLFYV